MPAQMPCSCSKASAAASQIEQQMHCLHANIATALQRCSKGLTNFKSTRTGRVQRLAAVCALAPRGPGWLPQQQRNRQLPQQRRQQLSQGTQLKLRQQQLPQQQTGQQDQLTQQEEEEQQQQQQQNHSWGYLSSSSDDWTWDDDYNEEAIAKAAAEARQLPPTPRQAQLAAAAAAAAQQRPTVITRLPEQFNRQVLSNAVLLVDKPARWSSADVVRQLKSALQSDKVCFGAPLDTHATGLLIILLGAASRLTPKLEPLERTYSGTFRLGVATTTYDASGDVLESNPWGHITDADISTAAQSFAGETQQVPCMWSSSKYKNKPLRWYAERGEVVAREPKSVYFASIHTWRPPMAASSSRSGEPVGDTVCFRVVASKGGSVRVLVHDIGKALGCGAHVTSLRREGVGGFSVDTAWSLEVLLPLARKFAKGFRQVRQY